MIETSKIDENGIFSQPDNADYDYVLEVDLHYADHLSHLHNEYPLALENIIITEDMLSPTQNLCWIIDPIKEPQNLHLI